MKRSRPSTRNRVITVDSGGGWVEYSVGFSELIEESRVGKFTNVRHYKQLTFPTGYLGRVSSPSRSYAITANCLKDDLLDGDGILQDAIAKARNAQSQSDDRFQFEIIPFLMDLDGTLAMFSRKFLRELSYGSVTWGVLPFISDVKSAVLAFQSLVAPDNARCWRTSRSRPILVLDRTPELRARHMVDELPRHVWVKGSHTMRGVIQYTPPDLSKPLNRLLRLLDAVGFHPDLKTAWDVIPLSFVVDYFLPIGDLLESLHPRGWANSAFKFTGFETVDATFATNYFYNNLNNGDSLGFSLPPIVCSYYERTYRSQLDLSTLSGIKWEAPSMKEIFNTAYLTTTLKKVF